MSSKKNPTAHRHDVLSSKQVIIGCGGGFRHECASRYSPVAQWMSEVDLALQDESQQYGNLDETAYSPTCGNSQSKTIRFDDRLSLERARHELKKKWQS